MHGQRHPDGNFRLATTIARFDAEGNVIERRPVVRRTLLSVTTPAADVQRDTDATGGDR